MNGGYLPVGCFGKLPCYGDFLRGKVFLATSLAFKDWVFRGHGGASAVADDSGTDPASGGAETDESSAPHPPELLETRSCRILLGIPGSAELMAGVIRPSVDSGSRRYFPFAVFAHFPRHAYARQYALVPIGLAATWDALDEAWRSLANLTTRDAFNEVLPALSVPVPTVLEEAKQSYRNLLASSASQALGESGTRLDEVMAFVPDALRRLKKKGDDESLLIELPGAPGEMGQLEAAFWIDLLNRQFLLKRFEPAVFLEKAPAGKPSRLWLLFGRLDAPAYKAIMTDSDSVPGVLRPASAPRDPKDEAPAGARGPASEATFQELLGTKFRSSI